MPCPFEGIEPELYHCFVGTYLTIAGDSNVVLRRDRNGVHATFTKPEEGNENSGKWILTESGEELTLGNVVTFKDGEVEISNLGDGDYETRYALPGSDKVYKIVFPLN